MNVHTAMFDPDAHGSSPLWRVFWLEGVLVSHLLFVLIALSYANVGTPSLTTMLAGFMIYTVWIIRRIWINSGNTATPVLGACARFLTVAWALNALLVCIFLALGHAAGEPFPLAQ